MSETIEGRLFDLIQLERQTLGDRMLEREVLQLFLQQISDIQAGIAAADDKLRREMAHALAGSARALGAHALADAAARIETGRQEAADLEALIEAARQTRHFVEMRTASS